MGTYRYGVIDQQYFIMALLLALLSSWRGSIAATNTSHLRNNDNYISTLVTASISFPDFFLDSFHHHVIQQLHFGLQQLLHVIQQL